jgi:hypothetical protein
LVRDNVDHIESDDTKATTATGVEESRRGATHNAADAAAGQARETE